MKKLGRYRRKKQNKIIIISTLSLLLFLCAGYAAFSTNLSLTAKGNVKEKSRVIQSWSNTDQTDFHSNFYKENIVSVTFLDNNNVPSNANESWNVSEDKENGGVIAWVVPNSNDNTKYDLYIGAKNGVIANEDSSYLFFNFRNVNEINFNENFDTSNVVNMNRLFQNCISLVRLDLSDFDTRNVTSMDGLFCMWDSDLNDILDNKLNSIIFGDNFITSSVINMRNMFAGLSSLKSIDVSNFDTSNVTDMFHMFYACKSLVSLDLSNFDTSKVTNMESMFSMYRFQSDNSLITINLCSFNTTNVESMKWIFQYTKNLKNVYVGSGWKVSKADITGMFEGSNISSVTTGQC